MSKTRYIHEPTLPAAPARPLAGQVLHKRGKKPKSVQQKAHQNTAAALGIPCDSKNGKRGSALKEDHPDSLHKDVSRSISDALSFIGKLKEKSFEKPAALPKRSPKDEDKDPSLLLKEYLKPGNADSANRTADEVTKCFQNRLSHQLQTLHETADSIRLRRSAQANTQSILKTTCKNFVVGKLVSMANSTTEFFEDRVEYYFQHPEQGKIHMIMFYKDMDDVRLNARQRRLRFKIVRPLHLFGGDYDHLVKGDRLQIDFGSKEDTDEFRKRVAHKMECRLGL